MLWEYSIIKTMIVNCNNLWKCQSSQNQFKGKFGKKLKKTKHLLTLIFLQTCLKKILNTEEDILKNVANQTVLGTIDFH